MTPILNLTRPTVSPLLILANLPHSGLLVPEAIRSQLTEVHQTFLPHQDWLLDRLYGFLPEFGITTLQATHSRYVVDLNRSLKPHQFWGFLECCRSRKDGPLGVPLYRTKPSTQEIQQRLRTYYQPYHEAVAYQLEQLLSNAAKSICSTCTASMAPLTTILGVVNNSAAGRIENVMG